MLKWAVHNARPSYLAAEQTDYHSTEAIDGAQCHVGRRETKLRRKSSTLCWRHMEKENVVGQSAQLTSTPLPGARATAGSLLLSRHVASPLERSLKRVQSLKDLSNILPETLASTTATTTGTATPMLPQTMTTTPQAQRTQPAHYASTLPTFEAEYSPCGLIPGPLLALRGVGIPDSYFEKPRYLAEIAQCGNTSMTSVLEEKSLKASCDSATKQHATAAAATNVTITATASDSIPQGLAGAAIAHTEQSMLSSTKMGDVTLERMIDAILASTRKERTRRHRRHGHAHANMPPTARRRTLRTMRKASTPATASGSTLAASGPASATATAANEASPSPTYRPAYDPASDLSEYWRSSDGALVAPSCGYQEREVRGSPTLGHSLNEHQQQQQLLRRQRAVRRKRQIAVKISTSVRQSAQKLLAAGRERVSGKVKQQQQKQHRHVSPDSGHNSTSDFDEDEQVEEQLSIARSFNANWLTERHESLDATKRRLSFSVHDNLLEL